MAFAALEMPLTPYLLNEPGQRKINTKEHQETGLIYSAPCFRRGKLAPAQAGVFRGDNQS